LRTVVEVADGSVAIPAVDVRDGTRTSQTADGSRRRHGRGPSQKVADPKAGDQEGNCGDGEDDRCPRFARCTRRFHAAASRGRVEMAMSESDPNPSHAALHPRSSRVLIGSASQRFAWGFLEIFFGSDEAYAVPRPIHTRRAASVR